MADLEHSKRSMERATYSPIKTQRQTEQPTGRALDKWSYYAALQASAQEVGLVLRDFVTGETPIPAEDRKYLTTLATAAADDPTAPRASTPLNMLHEFSPIPSYLLKLFGEGLLKVREAQVKNVLSGFANILERYENAVRAETGRPHIEGRIPNEYRLDADYVVPGVAGARVYRFDVPLSLTATAASLATDAIGAAMPGTVRLTATAGGLLTLPPLDSPTVATAESSPIHIATLHDWAVKENVQITATTEAKLLLQKMQSKGDLTLSQFSTAANVMVALTRDLNYAFSQRLNVEPIGMLHLERLAFIPSGIERGELLYSVPLSPGEEVNISHKEWSNTTQEFERIVTDFIENFSEEGVTEKSELLQSANSQREHSSGYDLGVTATGGWGPVSISASANYHVSDSASNSQTTARNHSTELTKKASSRVKKEHKQSFRVASASGTEDQAVRLIKNPFPDKATRVDYYQLVRKWRVDLYRYGLRMTYDLTIPEPGSDILSKIVEMRAITAALAEGFGGTTSTLPWARFDLTPAQITRGNYLALAAQYGVIVEAPPVEEIAIVRSFNRTWPEFDASKSQEYTAFDVDVPDGYLVAAWSTNVQAWRWEGKDYHFDVRPDLNTWLAASGRLTLTVGTWQLAAFDIQLKLRFRPSAAAYDAWKLRVWGTLREAAQSRYELNRTMLRDRLAQLQEEVGAQDPLSLRKIEREEVMKHVLRWLFGPTFTFVPPGLPPDLYGSNGSILNGDVWAKVLAQGEIIKFIHQAIEWEFMLYFLYPYFWSHTSRWELKKYLDHPDFMHKTFLKAGSARVVLTVRPGFEKDFVSFLETGTLNGLPENHPYLTIAEEMQAFAQTNYPGLRAANAIEYARPLLSPLQIKAWDQMQAIITLLEKYKSIHGAYPTTAQGLGALSSIGTVPSADPWGQPYLYKSPGMYADFELSSLGADGDVGGDGEDADIESWVDASLIGRWYEYTPTSAIDIAFNETLPSA